MGTATADEFDPLRDELASRPTFAYRLLEVLARSGWHVRIDRRSERPRVVAERDGVLLEESGETIADASVSVFRQAFR